MKKITITTKEIGLNDASGVELATLTDYVSDDYEESYTELNEQDDSDGINYTKTLRDIRHRLENIVGELENAWSALEVHSTLIVGDATLSDGDRETLTDALDAVGSSLYGLGEECDEPMERVDNALDAFKRLPIAE